MDHDPWKQDKDWTPPDGSADNSQVPQQEPVIPPVPPVQPDAPEVSQPQATEQSPYSVPHAEGTPYPPNYQNSQQPQQPYQQQSNYQQYQQPYQPYQQPYNANPYGQPVPETPLTEPGKGVGIASMVLGIISVVCCPLAFLGSIPGLICAIISMAKGYRKAYSIAGLVLSILGVLICIGWIIYMIIYAQDPYYSSYYFRYY